MQWQGSTAALPFDLRSAPLIFAAVADTLQWMMENRGVSWVAHYINDFVTIASPATTECSDNARTMHEVCERVGFAVEPEKDECPATILGIELDSMALEVCLPQAKLVPPKAALQTWRGRKACRKWELLSLIGSLSHACKAVRAGRSLLIDLDWITTYG